MLAVLSHGGHGDAFASASRKILKMKIGLFKSIVKSNLELFIRLRVGCVLNMIQNVPEYCSDFRKLFHII